MRYKLTLLKDLPDYPAGTVFYYTDDRRKVWDAFERMKFIGTSRDHMTTAFPFNPELIDNPVWIRKEPDVQELLDLRCPICGETRGRLAVNAYRIGDSEDGYRNKADVYFEYMCGHDTKRKLINP